MRRTFIALVLAPLLVSCLFGIFALWAFPMMLVVTFVIALPLTLWFKHIRRLNWWIALVGGVICALCYIAFNSLTPLAYGVAPNFDRLVNSNSASYLGLGMLTAFVFWWIGIFRNTAYPFVPRRFPFGALLAIPLILGCGWLNRSLMETYDQGRVTHIDVLPTKNQLPGEATVQLTHGPLVHADLSETWMADFDGRCVHVEHRWSTHRFRRIYEVNSLFGGNVNDC